MNLNEQYEQIHLKVLEKVRPKKDEKELLDDTFKDVVQKLQTILDNKKINAKIELSGSFSRDTWLSGNRDIDLFIILPYESEIEPEQLLTLIKEDFKLDWIKKHAKHPYLFAIYKGIDIEILPCYEFQAGRNLRSAVDRTPNHMQFIKNNLQTGVNDEVRLLKQFMRGVGVYGAEIKVNGFSGYLTELLVIHNNGKFLDVLKSASKLGKDIIKFKDDLMVSSERYKDDVLIVIDPVDDSRNVASPLKENTLAKFIAAANHYLEHPSINYFLPKPIHITKEKLNKISENAFYYCGMIYKEPKISDDILWGQIRKLERSLLKFYSSEGLNPIIIDSIITNNEIMTVLITLEKTTPKYKWLIGPPPQRDIENNFLEKHKNDQNIIYGPAIIDGRWKIIARQEKLTLDKVIQKGLESNLIVKPKNLQLKNMRVFEGKSLIKEIDGDQERMNFLYQLLKGTPPYQQE
ncbi:MAG: CCA tRNA nucleotidyltransferase [Asgard group archaeon]|nr:CCA tRNA nucleotidyltransferase [Asgard group archaeon]